MMWEMMMSRNQIIPVTLGRMVNIRFHQWMHILRNRVMNEKKVEDLLNDVSGEYIYTAEMDVISLE